MGDTKIPVPEQWGRLPLTLRQRWWRETEYGARAPSEDLIRAMERGAQETDEQIEKEKVLHPVTSSDPELPEPPEHILVRCVNCERQRILQADELIKLHTFCSECGHLEQRLAKLQNKPSRDAPHDPTD